VNVCAYARFLAVVPRSYCETADPVDERRRHSAVDAAVEVYVVVSQGQACAHDTLGRIDDLDIFEQELVDGTLRLAGGPVSFYVCEDVSIVGGVGGAHGCVQWRGAEWWEDANSRILPMLRSPDGGSGRRFADAIQLQRRQRETARTTASAGIGATFSDSP
jgi:hypothetical protein